MRRFGNFTCALIGILFGACRPQTSSLPSDGFDRPALISHWGEKVVLPTLRSAKSAALDLRDKASSWKAAPESSDARLQAQDAWKRTMKAWQRAEVMSIGPAAGTQYPGGQGLRDEVYSWPSVNPCRIDQELVSRRYQENDFFQTSLVTTYGLDALEYLLFYSGSENACSAQTNINSQGTWAALTNVELATRRSEYAESVANHLVATLEKLVEAWEKEGGFLSQLKQTQPAQDAINDVYRALFYVDLVTKSLKLGGPLGLTATCTATRCPERVESKWAKHSGVNLTENLIGFQHIFLGNLPEESAALGFDDLLEARGAKALSDQMLAQLNEMIENSRALETNFEEKLTSSPSELEALHASMRALVNLFKSQFATVLNLQVPDEGASDND